MEKIFLLSNESANWESPHRYQYSLTLHCNEMKAQCAYLDRVALFAHMNYKNALGKVFGLLNCYPIVKSNHQIASSIVSKIRAC